MSTATFTAAIMALATLFVVQGSRVFVGYLVFVVDQSERVTLGVTAMVVFSAPALVWLLVRVARAGDVLLGSATLLTVIRLVMQFWAHPTARLLLGAAIVIIWGWIAIVVLERWREPAAIGLLAGLGADIVVRMASGAIDLPWMPGIGSHMATIFFAVAMLTLLWLLRTATDTDPSISRGLTLPVVAVGPILALHHLVTGNLALAHVATGGERLISWIALLAGIALGVASLKTLGLATPDHRYGPARVAIGVAALLGGIGVGLFWTGSDLALVGVVLAPAALAVLIGAALAGAPVDAGNCQVGSVTAIFTLGLLIEVAVLFTYYTFTGLGAILTVAWIVLVAAAWKSGRFLSLPGLPESPAYRYAGGLVIAIVLAVALVPELVASEPETVGTTGNELTLMVYNIQSGFADDKRWDLKATAQAIQDENPDVVVLNEVGRGWLVTSGNDELPWLSRELGMPYVWGPASDDGLWGNAILSRFPMSEPTVRMFASTQNLKRSAIGVRIEVGVQGVWVFGTHLDNPRGAGEARMEQVNELLALWDNRTPAVVAGDFNATPDDDVLTVMAEAGFDDPGVRLAGAGTSSDQRRIDYILTTGLIEVLDIWIPDTDASDHKPVVARLRVGP